MMMKWLKHSTTVVLAVIANLACTPQAFAGSETINSSYTSVDQTSTNNIRGFNWADPGDNFQKGVIYMSGLTSSDTYSSAYEVANRVVGGFDSLTGANTVRMPINEATVSDYWGTYTGAIDEAANRGNVILAYWAYSGGKPANMTDFWNMWTTVVHKYARNSHVFFEVINEPHGYDAKDLNNLYSQWLAKFPQVHRDRVILDGIGYADDVKPVGDDSALNGTLLGVHDYGFWNHSLTTESQWESQFASEVGNYTSRTVCTEFGAPMTSHYNYDVSSSDYYVAFIRGITSEIRTFRMGSVLWPGLRDGDSYSLTTRNGSGSDITLTLNNASGLDRLRYSWGLRTGSSNIFLKNNGTGMYIDGFGSTSNGSNLGQWRYSGSTNQQWSIELDGPFWRLQNMATSMFIDGLGYTSNGSKSGQWSNTNSYNQQWSEIASENNVMFRNRATGLLLDGLGFTSNGSKLGQRRYTDSTNQQWYVETHVSKK